VNSWPPTLLSLMYQFKEPPEFALPIEERLPLLLAMLPALPFKAVKVTGTNGKGSVCAMLSYALMSAPVRVGTFTSPHLLQVNERMRINDVPIEDGVLERLARRWQQRLVALPPAAHPTFFEVLMVIALDWFHEQQAQIVVLEAGIGGRRDATRFVPGVVSVITTVGLDHVEKLGNSLEEVAAHKSDLCEDGGTLLLGLDLPAPALTEIGTRAIQRNLRLVTSKAPLSWHKLDQGWSYRVLFVDDGPEVQLPLAGAHQVDNLACVNGILQLLEEQGLIADSGCIAGVCNTVWPGRLQRLPKWPRLILDVAHNPQGLQALQRALDELGIPFAQRTLIYGISAEKDLAACVAMLSTLAPRVWLVDGFYRAAPAEEIRALLPSGLRWLGNLQGGQGIFDELLNPFKGRENDWFVATGSIFLVADVLQALPNLSE